MSDSSKSLYSKTYFQAYRDDPLRKKSYIIERDKIEKMKPEGGAIFDVGCGLGLFMEQFDASKWDRYGTDISEHAIATARTRGISVKAYEEGYDYLDASFDVIVFRGTIQHIDTPFAVLKKCVALLKPGGLLVFLVTPNANSICYKLFGTLPFLHPDYNFYIPSDKTLSDTLNNLGLKVKKINYPYLETAYAKPIKDHLYFLLRCLGVKVKFPFWRNTMELFAVKPQ